MHLVTFATVATDVLAAIGCLLNLVLIVIIFKYSKSMGNYKWVLISFASFECFYAAMVFVAKPVFYVHGSRSVVFSVNEGISNPILSALMVSLYCSFYQMWLGLVALMFLFRFLVVCKESWCEIIATSFWLKFLLVIGYIAHVSSTVFCGMLFCTGKIPQELLRDMEHQYNVKDVESMGYNAIAFSDPDGAFAWKGFASFGHHSVVCMISIMVMAFCGYKLSRKLAEWAGNNKEFRKNKQYFLTLVLQGTIPFAFYRAPLVFILISLFYQESTIGNLSPFISVSTTIPKVLHPLFTMFVIREYRYAIKQLFMSCVVKLRRHKVAEASNPTISVVNT